MLLVWHGAAHPADNGAYPRVDCCQQVASDPAKHSAASAATDALAGILTKPGLLTRSRERTDLRESARNARGRETRASKLDASGLRKHDSGTPVGPQRESHLLIICACRTNSSMDSVRFEWRCEGTATSLANRLQVFRSPVPTFSSRHDVSFVSSNFTHAAVNLLVVARCRRLRSRAPLNSFRLRVNHARLAKSRRPTAAAGRGPRSRRPCTVSHNAAGLAGSGHQD